jgi:hypothetical protein
MTGLSTYQPFLIGEGQSKTGLFQYLESWVKPGDAYDILEEAYVFRGSLWKRQGMARYPSTPAPGALVYSNSSQVGNITTAALTSINFGSAGSSVIPVLPIIASSVSFSARTSAGVEKWTDNGVGVLTGSLGDTGTINYINGQWSLTTSGGRTFNNPTQIWATYSFATKGLTSGGPFNNPIMGIKLFTNEANNQQILVVMDTRRASYHNGSSFVGISAVSQTIARGDGISLVETFTSPFIPIAPFSVSITDGVNTITDLGNGTLTTAGNMVGPNTVNYATGAISLTLTAGNLRTYSITLTAAGDYFTGDNTNFFNSTNWKPTDSAPGLLYLTNNIDRVTVFDGTSLGRPPFCTTLANYDILFNEIKTTLDVKIYKNSLIFIRPTIVGSSIPEAQTIRSSIPSNRPNFSISDFVGDITGHGATTQAPTGDWIMSAQFLRDVIVIFFLNSAWLFRFTESAFDPFRFTKVNSSKSCQAPYGSIEYDTQCTAMGNKGLIFCDGVNVDRYDINIIDQYLSIETKAFGQCFGQRFDILQQTWMLYPQEGDATGGADQLTSSRALIYNFLEQTWAVYRPNLGNTIVDPTIKNTLSCLGLGFTTTDATWASFAPGGGLPQSGAQWKNWDEPWNSYVDLAAQPALLGGDQNGIVFQLNTTNTDDLNPILSNILTKRFNPFLPAQKAAFGYLDVYYEVAPEVTLTFNFYANNSSAAQHSQNMQLKGSGSNNFFWQRVYLNGLIGEFLQIGITDDGSSTWKILGMILHAAPAGRLTPGSFL